ncbi:MAG: substrate-binding domain-containing protein [Syntrophobacterales bacterium]|nr:MAG: substrate-binding domain-containing protein [Syntrophobacterales bacterium]
MKKSLFLILVLILILSLTLTVGLSPPGSAQERLKVSSTTSTDNTGLFQALNPPFESRFGCRVDVIAVGTGKALKIGEMGDCDVVFVHSRPAENAFMDAGHGVNRRDVMYNDFIIIGPTNDPAGIQGTRDAKKALAAIAKAGAHFISRGDDSGTHKKEKSLWKKSGIVPKGRWYLEAGQGMGAVIHIANEKSAYALADRGTYLAYRKKVSLEILCEGDPDLFNPYGIIAINPAKHPGLNYVLAMAYIGWVTSPDGQKIIREFGKEKFGQALFKPAAIP